MDENIIYKGRGFYITQEDEHYQIAFQVGITSKTVYYDISKENAYKAMQSDEDADDVLYYAKNGRWPPTEEEQLEAQREFIRKFPKLLLKNEHNKTLFDKEELEELMEKIDK